jgi:hypothetical protein
VNWNRVERGIAWASLGSLLLAPVATPAIDTIIAHPGGVFACTGLAGVLLLTWMYLCGAHLRRIFLGPAGQYSAGDILTLLFVPYVGLAWVTLRKVPSAP